MPGKKKKYNARFPPVSFAKKPARLSDFINDQYEKHWDWRPASPLQQCCKIVGTWHLSFQFLFWLRRPQAIMFVNFKVIFFYWNIWLKARISITRIVWYNLLMYFNDQNCKSVDLNCLYLQARIKKIMQSDDEVGKVAAPVPVIISRALELFAETLLQRARKVSGQRGARTLTPSHLWVCLSGEIL